jgi:hypothetical protein
MENTQDTRWAIAEMNWRIEGLIDRAFANTEYVSISRPYTGGSTRYHAGDALRTGGNWQHHDICVCGAIASEWRRCR